MNIFYGFLSVLHLLDYTNVDGLFTVTYNAVIAIPFPISIRMLTCMCMGSYVSAHIIKSLAAKIY